mmetsp:Transcript_22579/g.64169  ORF Transcript_22579/g.64169 Transcript_22579/m.64169 type:complete len:366 (-) Transcript_22579:226-1323(-)
MASAKKENDGVAGNQTPRGAQRTIDKLRRPAFTCSPVREETPDGPDDEEFTEDLGELERKLQRDHQKARRAEALEQRRQTMAGTTRRVSVGGGGKRAPRRSFGGGSHASGLGAYEQHAMNDLKDELRHREKLDHTRQHRLNALDIKFREAENRLQNLQSKYRDLKREKDELARQNNELRKKNKQLTVGKQRLEDQKKQQERTISILLAKVGSAASLKRSASQRRQPRPSVVSATSSNAGTPTDDDGESFADGEEVLANVKPPSAVEATRRYTMAPGEASRIRSSSRVVVKESHSIRIDGLPKGSMSKDAADMCQEFGLVVHARVTKCVVSGELKGYLTFAEANAAREAVKSLRIKGLKAFQVDDS